MADQILKYWERDATAPQHVHGHGEAEDYRFDVTIAGRAPDRWQIYLKQDGKDQQGPSYSDTLENAVKHVERMVQETARKAKEAREMSERAHDGISNQVEAFLADPLLPVDEE